MACLARQTYHVAICVAGEPSRIFYQVGKVFLVGDFVKHGALYVTFDIDKGLIGGYDDYVTFLQADVTRVFSSEKVFIYVDIGYSASVAHNLHVSHRADFVDAACAVKGVEHGCER